MGRILFRNQSKRLLWLRNYSAYPEGWLLSLFWLVVGRMSPARASATGRRLMRRLGPGSHKHRRIRRNLRLAFPDLDEAEIERLACGTWENFGAVLAEYPHLSRIRATGPNPRIDVLVDSATRPVLADQRPAIYVSAHLGNWELVAPTLSTKGIPLSLVYGPQGNPVLERLIQARRESGSDCRYIAKHRALQQLVRDIRAGRSIGMLPDQRLDSGEMVDFFGRPAPTTTSPAWLALKLNCPLIPVQVERTADARYRMTFHAPLLSGCEPADPAQILRATARLNALFEQWIRARPEQWLCMKRRWPEAACRTEPGGEGAEPLQVAPLRPGDGAS